jgi:mRNA-degrading endonuclease YafQ of YafQ-DinJ toxin-antitoxin module
MKELVWHNSFRCAFKRVTRKNPQLENKIYDVLDVLRRDPFTPSLKTHKLKGKLEGSWAC